MRDLFFAVLLVIAALLLLHLLGAIDLEGIPRG